MAAKTNRRSLRVLGKDKPAPEPEPDLESHEPPSYQEWEGSDREIPLKIQRMDRSTLFEQIATWKRSVSNPQKYSDEQLRSYLAALWEAGERSMHPQRYPYIEQVIRWRDVQDPEEEESESDPADTDDSSEDHHDGLSKDAVDRTGTADDKSGTKGEADTQSETTSASDGSQAGDSGEGAANDGGVVTNIDKDGNAVTEG